MKDPSDRKIDRLSELPQVIAPPHDGWPALEAKLRGRAIPQPDHCGARHGTRPSASGWRPWVRRAGALAAVLAALVVGLSIDRWISMPSPPAAQVRAAAHGSASSGDLTVAYLADPRYVRARAALLRALNARLAKLPPPTRQKVLESLATLRKSLQEIQQALGREPGNALLQELLIDTTQDQMQVLSTAQALGGGGGESRS